MIRDLARLIAEAAPVLHERPVAVVGLDRFEAPGGVEIIASFREAEGLTVYLDYEAARELPVAFKAAWITMSVNSALDAVGFTAAFAAVLAQAGIACNVMAGARHDHLFVPWERRDDAMKALRGL